MFEATIVDRRVRPSHGYRAVRVIPETQGCAVEIQLRTDLRHGWAGLSAKLADTFGIEFKYGGGPANVRQPVNESSTLIADFEQHLDMNAHRDERIRTLKQGLRETMSLTARTRRERA